MHRLYASLSQAEHVLTCLCRRRAPAVHGACGLEATARAAKRRHGRIPHADSRGAALQVHSMAWCIAHTATNRPRSLRHAFLNTTFFAFRCRRFALCNETEGGVALEFKQVAASHSDVTFLPLATLVFLSSDAGALCSAMRRRMALRGNSSRRRRCTPARFFRFCS